MHNAGINLETHNLKSVQKILHYRDLEIFLWIKCI